ncbi:MAG: D-galactonate dehydratase family protein [Thermomicrobiales bacterium]
MSERETETPVAVIPDVWDAYEGDSGAVRIRDVRVILTAPDGIRLVVVKVETTEPGLYGVGCATFTQRPLAVKTAVEEYLRPFLIGRDVHNIEDIWQASYLSSYWRSGPVLNNAMSGVDMALWDIKGKIANLPVYQLLGGKNRDAATLYSHASGATIEEVEENVRALMAEGFTHVRAQVGVPGGATYGVSSKRAKEAGRRYSGRLEEASEERWNPSAYCRIVPKLFDHLRSTVGDEVELLHDIHERIAPIQAIQLAKDLEPYHLFFLEDPFAPEDNGYFPLLRQHSAIPIAMGELYVNQAEYVPLIKDRLIDFIRVHISDIGGITPARKLAALCEYFGVRTAWHGPGDVSPVGHAANLALDLAVPNFGIQEAHIFRERTKEVFPGCPEIHDGAMWSNDKPGLGIDVDEELAAKYPFPEHPINGAWPEVRTANGSIIRP